MDTSTAILLSQIPLAIIGIMIVIELYKFRRVIENFLKRDKEGK